MANMNGTKIEAIGMICTLCHGLHLIHQTERGSASGVKDLFGEFFALIHEPLNGALGKLGAPTVGATIAAVALVETPDKLGAPQCRRPLRVDQAAHLITPFLAFIGPAERSKVVHRAQHFRELEQLLVIVAGIFWFGDAFGGRILGNGRGPR